MKMTLEQALESTMRGETPEMKNKMHEQWDVLIQRKYDKTDWHHAKPYYSDLLRDWYCESYEEAKTVLDYVLLKFNGIKLYNENGERNDTKQAGNGVGVTIVNTRKTDNPFMIVRYRIRKRFVSDWEEVEIEN